MRMSHVLSLYILADRKLVSFPTHSFDSVEPEGCSDNLARMDYVEKMRCLSLLQKLLYLLRHLVERRLPFWLYIRLTVHVPHTRPTNQLH